MADIFDARIFGRNSDFSKYAAGIKSLDSAEEDDVWVDGDYEYIITIFDYILAQRLDLVPFDEDHIAYDWMGFSTVGTVTLNKFYKTVCGRTYSDIVNNCVVHGDIFNDARLDVREFFLALTIPPEPYKVCCMQWDAYIELFRSMYDTLSSDSNNFYLLLDMNVRSNANRILWAFPVMHTMHDINLIQEFQSSPMTPYARCMPDYSAVNESDWRRRYLVIPYAMLSELGGLDLYFNRVPGPYETNRSIWSANVGRLPVSTYPMLYVGETFFSDVYGC